jgi:hypothetical protein
LISPPAVSAGASGHARCARRVRPRSSPPERA